jgi:hypothetical protein
MLDNVDLGIILNREFDSEGNEYMVFKNIKERVKTFRDYICQPFHKDNSIKLIEDYYSPIPVFRESLYNDTPMNKDFHNNNVKNNGYNTNIITINDDEENLYEYSQMYSSENANTHNDIVIQEEEETFTPNLANFVNPFGFNPIPIIQEEPQLTRGVSYDVA